MNAATQTRWRSIVIMSYLVLTLGCDSGGSIVSLAPGSLESVRVGRIGDCSTVKLSENDSKEAFSLIIDKSLSGDGRSPNTTALLPSPEYAIEIIYDSGLESHWEIGPEGSPIIQARTLESRHLKDRDDVDALIRIIQSACAPLIE